MGDVTDLYQIPYITDEDLVGDTPSVDQAQAERIDYLFSVNTGPDGKSAYDAYVDSVQPPDTPLSEEDWLESLNGDVGASTYDGLLPAHQEPVELSDTTFGHLLTHTSHAPLNYYPIGTVIEWAGTYVDNGWLWCDGKAYDYTKTGNKDLGALYSIIGHKYGGSGAMFAVPDKRSGVGECSYIIYAGGDTTAVTSHWQNPNVGEHLGGGGSGGSGGLAELGYAEKNTNTFITSTNPAAPANVVGPLTVETDGSPVLVEFSTWGIIPPPAVSNAWISVGVSVDGGASERLGYGQAPPSSILPNYNIMPAHLQRRFELPAGSHTFEITAYVSSGQGEVQGGNGGAPALLRVSQIEPVVSDGGGGGDGRSSIVSFAESHYTSGDILFNSTSWTDFNAATDLTLEASVGDVVEISLSGYWQNSSAEKFIDCVTVVNGSAVNSLGHLTAVSSRSATAQGIVAYKASPGVFQPASGSYFYKLKSDDVSNGSAVLRLQARLNSSVGSFFYATADYPFVWSACNHGPEGLGGSDGGLELGMKYLDNGGLIVNTDSNPFKFLDTPLSVECDDKEVMVEVYFPGIRPSEVDSSANWIEVKLDIDGARVLDQFGLFISHGGDSYRPATLRHRVTLSPGTHTFDVTGSCSNGSYPGFAEVGQSGTRGRAFIRVIELAKK